MSVPYEQRGEIWGRVARDLPLDKLEETVEVIPLAAVPERAEAILAGRVRGRTVVDVNA